MDIKRVAWGLAGYIGFSALIQHYKYKRILYDPEQTGKGQIVLSIPPIRLSIPESDIDYNITYYTPTYTLVFKDFLPYWRIKFKPVKIRIEFIETTIQLPPYDLPFMKYFEIRDQIVRIKDTVRVEAVEGDYILHFQPIVINF